MSSLNVVCLISGGKDSLFSILHCIKNGHRIVALANLHPPHRGSQNAVEDLDSYMYQTVGHTVIPLYEKALELPLYRQEIHGSALNQDRCYGPDNEDDETEELIPLLRRVQSHHAEVDAVSTGAILSDYQRTRVESVAIRLGLVPLSYLWQYPNLLPHSQTSLLQHMATVGQDSRIIKVASGGLDESFLWQNVASPRTITRLETAAERFGTARDGAVLGEGGEYETLALNGPSCLWKAQIVVRDSDTTIVPGDAGTASISVAGAQVSSNKTTTEVWENLHVPPLLEPDFQRIFEEVSQRVGDERVSVNASVNHDPSNAQSGRIAGSPEALDEPSAHFFPDITGDGSTAAEETRSIMKKAIVLLGDLGHVARDVVCTSIILRDMADFPAMNSVYSTYFRHPNPPARVTIACASVLPASKRVMASLTVSTSSKYELRNGLHVQSRSYWAPANIGPYSQAIATPLKSMASRGPLSLVYIAGQIPLVPATMELPDSAVEPECDSFLRQALLALQHTVRIGRTMQVKSWAGAIAFITAPNAAVGKLRASIACQTWDALHQPRDIAESDGEQDAVDLWELKYGASRRIVRSSLTSSGESSTHGNSMTPAAGPLHVFCVDSLPRASTIEWVVYGTTAEAEPFRIPQYEHFLRTFQRHSISLD